MIFWLCISWHRNAWINYPCGPHKRTT